MALYSQGNEDNLFWKNVTMDIIKDGGKVAGSHLHLHGVTEWDSGLYKCYISTFPFGTLTSETELTVKDSSIICNVTGPVVKLYQGENMTIECNASLSNTQYSWTKNGTVLSENEFLKLEQVTAANAGVYAFHVTGYHNLTEELVVTVQQVTTNPVTSQAVTNTTESSPATSPTSRPSTPEINTSVSARNESRITATLTSVERLISPTNSSQSSVTSFPLTDSNTSHLLSPTKSYHGATVDRSTHESELHSSTQDHSVPLSPEWAVTSQGTTGDHTKPDVTQTLSTRGRTPFIKDEVRVNEDKDSGQSRQLLALILIPVLLLVAVVGFFCRRRIKKKRMDKPPPFKPPPPPVKYTGARYTNLSLHDGPQRTNL
ncbi:T-cell surface protein tactile isoform X2 [Gouania willdenowi]|nr:T-cell surface protein tactile-like isoform X2 [Gouania willdenowi]XP_028322929.1 T-cell surface protein tactile-like isoform X2 [Gouania willdenowi]